MEGNPVNRTDPSGFSPRCDDNCKLELFNATAAGIPWAGHYAIVHTDKSGVERVIEAFPSEAVNYTDIGNPFFWDPVLHPYASFTGIIKASIRKISIGDSINARNNPLIDVVTIVKSEEVCGKLTCLRNAMRQVEKNKIGYYIMGPNSNSAAISVLKYCNLPWQTAVNDLASKRFRENPGKDLYLLSPEANSRADKQQINEAIQSFTSSHLTR